MTSTCLRERPDLRTVSPAFLTALPSGVPPLTCLKSFAQERNATSLNGPKGMAWRAPLSAKTKSPALTLRRTAGGSKLVTETLDVAGDGFQGAIGDHVFGSRIAVSLASRNAIAHAAGGVVNDAARCATHIFISSARNAVAATPRNRSAARDSRRLNDFRSPNPLLTRRQAVLNAGLLPTEPSGVNLSLSRGGHAFTIQTGVCSREGGVLHDICVLRVA